MERLTKYDEFGNAEFVGIDNTKLYERLVCDETVALTIATNKLGKLEDALEKYGIKNAEELEDYLTPKLFCYAKLSENLDEFKKYCQFEPIINIDTCEPQVELITDKIKDLEQELAELKQKAIVPKFKVGQKIFFIDTNFQIEQGVIYQIRMFQMDSSEWGNHLIDLGQEYEDDIRFIYEDEEEIFATKDEAEMKLAEIGGKDE